MSLSVILLFKRIQFYGLYAGCISKRVIRCIGSVLRLPIINQKLGGNINVL